MWRLKDAVEAAIQASGKSAARIARDARIDQDTISGMRTGANVNPELDTLTRFANATGTTVVALLGGSFQVSREDEDLLGRMRRWIDSKLATIDALRQPNAEILEAPPTPVRKIADAQRAADNPFIPEATLRLRAIGESMAGDGILSEDTVYATALGASAIPPIGKIIACRLGDGVFIKRLASEQDRRLLLSAHPSYRPIDVDASGLTLEILGVVIGRIGRVW